MTLMNQLSAGEPPEKVFLFRHAVLLLLCVGALWLFMLQARVLADGWVVAVWAGVTLVMLRGLFRRARIRRRAWRNAYLYPESAWNRRLRGGVLMGITQFVKAATLAAFLLITVTRVGSEADFWRLLLVAALVLLLARLLTEQWFWRHASPAYRPELVARVGQWGTGAFLVLCLLFWALVEPQPDFREAGLDQALWYMMDREVAASALVEEGTRAMAAWQGVEQWLAQKVTALDLPSWFRAGVWVSVLLRQSLFAVSLVVLCNGVLSGRLDHGRG